MKIIKLPATHKQLDSTIPSKKISVHISMIGQIFRSVRLIALISTIFSLKTRIGHAQLLSAYEQAYGRWDIKLSKNIFCARRRWHLQTLANEKTDVLSNDRQRLDGRRNEEGGGDLQLLFPYIPIERNSTLDEGNEIQYRFRNEHARKTTKSVRSVSCVLNLEKNGKFSLSLAEEADGKDDRYETGAPDEEDRPASIKHQALRGEWYLTPNPYCVTDRHYDELLLVSETRTRRRSNIRERARVEMRCQVWGRYGAGAVRKKIGIEHGRIRGRMNHGTIVIVKEDVEDGIGSGKGGRKTSTIREVVGTFAGRAIVNIESSARKPGSLVIKDNIPVDEQVEDDDLDPGDEFDEFVELRPIEK